VARKTKGLPLQTLHDQERLAVVLADVEEAADVGMVERGDGPSLPHEARQGLLVPGELRRDGLQGDPQALVSRGLAVKLSYLVRL
jgi:hypothetical protein